MVRHTAHIKRLYFSHPYSVFPPPSELLSLIVIAVEWCIVYQGAARVELTGKMHRHLPEGKRLKQKKQISNSFLHATNPPVTLKKKNNLKALGIHLLDWKKKYKDLNETTKTY